MRRPRAWWRDESGAVTVDWVVLTAALTGLGIALITLIATAASDPAEGLGAVLGAHETGIDLDGG